MRPDQIKRKIVPALSFRWATRFYDPVVRLTVRESAVKGALIDAALLGSESAVLDVGAGTGTLSIALKTKERRPIVIALDADEEILWLARRKSRYARAEIELLAGFSDQIPIATRSVDLVVSTFFFHHITRPERSQTFEEILRVLRPGGRLFFADFGRPEDMLQSILSMPIRLGDGWERTKDNFRGKLTGELIRAGFKDIKEIKRFRTLLGTVHLTSASRAK